MEKDIPKPSLEEIQAGIAEGLTNQTASFIDRLNKQAREIPPHIKIGGEDCGMCHPEESR